MNIKNNISKIFLVVSNLIPLYGVFFWGWNSTSIIFVYWMENIAIGSINILKIIKAKGEFHKEDLQGIMKIERTNDKNKFELIISFIFNYGLFTFVHGIFIKSFFGIPNLTTFFILTAFLPLFISHLISYKTNFINNGEYLKVSPVKLSNQPYNRVLVMHLTLLFGGIVSNGLGNPLYALITMIMLKIILDLYLHYKEHRVLNNIVIN